MKLIISLTFFTFYSYFCPLMAQSPQVPRVIHFADMELRLNEQARREIQMDVDALYRSPSYFQIKLDRVNLYMPTVERVLKEQGVPEDLKYLVIQESSLISDAVSTSNAVGFWQFKKGTAEEVFLKVDNQIDERKNIVSSTKGAALYLKKHQNHLDNWACALVSYQMGLGGARKYFGDRYKGHRTMNINRNSHWYLKKFLAHKIAFEGVLGKPVSQGGYLQEYRVIGPTSLAEIAKDLGIPENHLKEQNKWTSNGKIPAGRPYTVTYIQEGPAPKRPVLASDDRDVTYTSPTTRNTPEYPKITGNKNLEDKPGQIKINGIKGILATRNASQEEFSAQIGTRKRKLRRVNDLKKSDKIKAGNYYYTKRKKSKAKTEKHIVKPGETLWEISQTYGIRLHSLKAKNRIYKDADLKPGMVLKLQKYRKRNEEVAYEKPAPLHTENTSSPPKEKIVHPSPPIRTTSHENSSLTTKTEDINYLVKAGDTLYAISRKYEVTIDQLKEWNNLNNETLSIGQTIIIKK